MVECTELKKVRSSHLSLDGYSRTMKVLRTMRFNSSLVTVCFCLTALCVVESAITKATGVVGGKVTIQCSYADKWYGKSNDKYFCGKKCDSYNDVLVQTQKNKNYIERGRYAIHDYRDGDFTVTIKNLMKSDSGTYWCKVERFGLDSFQEVQLIVTDASKHSNQEQDTGTIANPIYFTATNQKTDTACDITTIYATATNKNPDTARDFTTIDATATNPCADDIYSNVGPSTEVPDKGNDFKVIIRQLTKQDEGTYWCGVDKPNAIDSYTKVELDVKTDDCCEKSVTETVYLGGEATISCNYPEDCEDSTKHFCKEHDFFICNSMNSNNNKMYDNRTEKFYSVTISDLTEDDTGTYWCGVETGKRKESYIALITQVKLRVISTSVVIMVSVSLVVLLLVISLIIVYRWKYNKATGSVSSTHTVSPDKGNNEGGCHGDGDYEAIKERPLQSDSDAAPTTIYTTANLPTSHSDSPHYTSVNFHQNPSSPNEARVTITKEGTSSCDYATVNFGQSPAYSTVNHPHSSSEAHPIYSTVSKPRHT
ncbi:polymeric immunoglobulin receptor-like [Coregonus clupeaformis]|uniref:polymeric immunoglobulin receptor-like n=1 Tax=Coregonus clupeaformis TaxID=59861 RepID=UPI001E1C4ABD|nr:polymeric immunoglobulin receptor-like [Coregonus clupeaformis]